MSAMAATGAALRLRLLFRMLRAGDLLALLAHVSWSSSRAPSVATAAVVVLGVADARFVFVLGNAIVLLLLALPRRERDPSPASSNHLATSTFSPGAAVEVEQIPAAPAAASFPSYAAPTMPTPESELPVAVVATSAPKPKVLPRREMATMFEEVVKPAAAATRAVFSKARAPRRSRSEKMRRSGGGARLSS